MSPKLGSSPACHELMSTGSQATLPGFNSGLLHLLAVQSWATGLISLSLSFLYSVGTTIAPPSKGCHEN